MIRTALLVLILCLLVLTASGCGGIGFTFDPQDLYSLPKLPPKYDELSALLTEITDSGAEYAAPASGTNIQAVQMVDLNGDGQEEAVAFFRNAADEKPLKIYIFEALDDSYRQSAVIEGSGTGIYSIAYNDLDRDGRTELLVGWRVSTDMQALSVYSLRGKEPEELVRTNYVKYAVTDLDQDQRQELVVLRSDTEGSGIAEYYNWQEGGLLPQSSARISITMAELSQQGRVKTGTLRGEAPALFVTGVVESSAAITDILAVKNGELTNVVLSNVTGVSTEISEFSALYPMDLNGDGLTEVPCPVLLPVWGYDGEAAVYRRVDWQTYDIEGQPQRALSTYHDTEDGWYLQLPDAWDGAIQVMRGVTPNEASVSFYIRGSGTEQPKEFLRISTLTGTSRESRAVRGNRFNLNRQSDTIYVAELLEANDTWAYGITEDEVRSAFSLIRQEWLAGDN
ncbi:FG-GAP repeat domain-containing protein [Dysosmobacter sp.]